MYTLDKHKILSRTLIYPIILSFELFGMILAVTSDFRYSEYFRELKIILVFSGEDVFSYKINTGSPLGLFLLEPTDFKNVWGFGSPEFGFFFFFFFGMLENFALYWSDRSTKSLHIQSERRIKLFSIEKIRFCFSNRVRSVLKKDAESKSVKKWFDTAS